MALKFKCLTVFVCIIYLISIPLDSCKKHGIVFWRRGRRREEEEVGGGGERGFGLSGCPILDLMI